MVALPPPPVLAKCFWQTWLRDETQVTMDWRPALELCHLCVHPLIAHPDRLNGFSNFQLLVLFVILNLCAQAECNDPQGVH